MKITTVGVCIICGIFPLLILPQLPGTLTLASLTVFACVLVFIPFKTVRYIALTLLFFVWGILAAKQILWAGETLTGATQDAIVEITGPDGVRRIPIHDFYIKAGVVDLKPAEIQTAIIIPKEAYEGYHGHYIKYAMRNAMDIATTGCSVNVKLSEDKKTIKDVRIAYGVAGPVPMRAPSAEAKAKGKPLTKAVVHEFGQAVLEDINPRDSWRASKAFRQHIATVLAERALTESIRLAGGVIDE